MAEDYGQWLKDLSQKSGATVEASDITNMQGKNPEDVEMFKKDLEAQYARRGASGQTGSGPEGSTVRAPSDIAKGFGPGGSNENPAGPGGGMSGWLGGGGGSGGSSSSSSSSSGGMFPDWYKDMMTKNMARSDELYNQNKERGNALYEQLLGRSQQGLALDRNDPVIRAQADAFSANQERARRNYLSDAAERSGPLANLSGERRMAAERSGIASGSFEAELMGRELTARRQEIASALAQMGGLLTADQTRQLQTELAQMDQAIAEAGVGVATRGQDLTHSLGQAGLSNAWQQALLGNNQFMANLGLQAEDQYNRWNDPLRT